MSPDAGPLNRSMPRKARRLVVLAAGLALLSVTFLTVWALLARDEKRREASRRPDWLTVEASPVPAVGAPWELRVTLKPLGRTELIVCGLRWTATDQRISGGLSSAGPARKTSGGETLTFRPEVKEKEDMTFVSAVIYLSPTGRWSDRTAGASTELVRVRRTMEAEAPPPPRPLKLHRVSTPAEEATGAAKGRSSFRSSSIVLRPLLVIVLAASGVLGGLRSFRARGRPRAAWAAIALVLSVSALLELLAAPARITEALRLAAMAQGLYELRRPIQGAVLAVAALAAGGAVLFLYSEARGSEERRRLAWAAIGTAVYLALTFVGMLSFHPVDELRRLAVLGVSPFHAARGIGALIALAAALPLPGPLSTRRTRRAPFS